jgi:hypothetical protein
MFVVADRFGFSVPWKVMDYGIEGALGETQINSIAAEFTLGLGDLRELSRALAVALDPTMNLIPISRSTATARAAKEVQRAYRKVETAKWMLNDAILRLERLQANPAGDPEGAELLRQTMVLLNYGDRQVSEARRKMAALSRRPHAALLIAPDDKRRLHDGRRELVLDALFSFWGSTGRKLSYTTDPLTSKRRGRLLDFVNSVVACITDPPATLSGETIVTEIGRFRRQQDRHLSVQIDSGSRDQHT